MKLLNILIAMVVLPILLAFAGCVPTSQGGPGAVMTAMPIPEEAMQKDAAEYARQFGVSQEEAQRQLGLENEIGELNADLQREQADTFAGLWIQHEPEYRVVVAFTKDAGQIIQPYLKDKTWADLVALRTFPHSMAELEAAQQKVMQVAEASGISMTSSISVTENKVTVEVGNPDLFLEELRSAGQELPELAELVAFDPDHLTDTLRGGIETYSGPGDQTIYFPKQAPTNVYMAALIQGTLTLDANGCLRIESEGGNAPLVVWRYDFTLRVQGDTIEVVNGQGQVVARVGEPLQMGGGESTTVNGAGFPIDACPGPFWIMGDIEPLAAQAIPHISVQSLQIQKAEGSTSEVRTRYQFLPHLLETD